jgi:ABC-type cobalamin/Fe3+-siderophores transport system ATPase subunit
MDVAGEHAIMELIKSLHEQDKLTIVMVSHLLNVVVNYARKLALIDGGLRMVGPTADVLTSENLTGIYEAPVQIAECGDRKVVLTGGGDA